MDYILSNNKKIPSLGYGVFRMENDELSKDLILQAFEKGYRHIDTATAYNNEEIVGQAIKESGLRRDEIFVTTKLANKDMRADNVKNALMSSLEKLQLDYVDLYLTHWPVPEKYIPSYLELETYKEQGYIKSLGVSNLQIHHLKDLEKHCSVTPVVNQIEVNPYLFNEDVVNYCQERNILIEAYSPLCSNKNDVLSEPILAEIAKKYNKTSAQVIIRWLLQRNILPLVKSSTPQRINENFEVYDFTLTDDDMKNIKSLNTNTRSMSDPDNFNF